MEVSLVARCTAAKTGKHRDFDAHRKCPVCGPRFAAAKPAVAFVMSTPPKKSARTPEKIREDALSCMMSDDPDDRIWAVQSNALSPEELDQMYDAERSWEVKEFLLRSRDIPIHHAEGIAMNNDTAARRVLASREDCPEKLLEELATDRAIAVRKAAARNPMLPKQSLLTLISDKDDGVAIAAFNNKNFADAWYLDNYDYLVSSAQYPSGLRAQAAQSDKVSEEVLEQHIRASNYDIAISVVNNPKMPLRALLEYRMSGSWPLSTVGLKEATERILDARMCDHLGIDRDNQELIDHLRDERWWEMDDDSPEVITGKIMYQNRER